MIFSLPDKYRFNKESLTENKYIDDNALFLYFCLSKGLFSNKNAKDKYDSALSFLFLLPFEWTSIDVVSFFLSVCKNCNFKIVNIETEMGAVEDDYEISYNPRKYQGAYKWMLELQEKEPNREEVILFDKFLTNTASVADLERALIYADRTAPSYKGTEKNEIVLSKDIFNRILFYTSFSIKTNEASLNTLKKDIKSYLKAFRQDALTRNSKSKRIGNTSVTQPYNIFTYKKHEYLLREYLHKMQEDFGNIVTIENIFEDKFPNLEYPDSEFIRKRYEAKRFFFIHTLLTFGEQKLIKIFSIHSSWDRYDDKMLTYQAEIEILPKLLNENSTRKLHFDVDKSRFYIQGKNIKITKFGDEYHTLRIIFEKPKELSQEWFFSEIAERIDSQANSNDKKYYNAIYQLKIKLEKEGIKDFFITTKQSVKINKKYLS